MPCGSLFFKVLFYGCKKTAHKSKLLDLCNGQDDNNLDSGSEKESGQADVCPPKLLKN
jgi:hypothetical protein